MGREEPDLSCHVTQGWETQKSGESNATHTVLFPPNSNLEKTPFIPSGIQIRFHLPNPKYSEMKRLCQMRTFSWLVSREPSNPNYSFTAQNTGKGLSNHILGHCPQLLRFPDPFPLPFQNPRSRKKEVSGSAGCPQIPSLNPAAAARREPAMSE